MSDSTYLDWPFLEDRHRQLRADLYDWCGQQSFPQDGDVDECCRSLVADLGKAGILRNCVPADWGGASETLDVRSLALCRETLAYHCGLADISFAMQGLGAGPVGLFGSDLQKERLLPPVSAGGTLPAFALTEPDAGSDVAGITTTARSSSGHFIIDGRKTWISNGGIADFYIVFARTGERPGAGGLSAFIVPADSEGLVIEERIDIMSPHPLATLRFDSVRVEADQMVGEPGAGFKVAMATLDVFRPTVGAAALGLARRALDEAMAFAKHRRIGDSPLSDYQMTQASIAEMATAVDAAALLVYRAAWAKDNGAPRVSREASMAKLFATEQAQRVIDQALQLHGGQGVRSGQKVEELYRDIRSMRVYEGASEVQKIIIAKHTLGS